MGASDENQATSGGKPARAHSALGRTDLGLRIRALRQERGLSQRKAAGALISPSFMSRLESGDRNVGVTVLQALTVTMPDVRFVIEGGELRIEVLPKI